MSSVRSLVFAGVGGQGIVLASKLVAHSALRSGAFVRTAETIGMAQRGGSVVSHVRIGDDAHSPLVPLGTARAIVAFEPAEAVRCLPYLHRDGTVVVSTRAVPPVTAALSGSEYDGSEALDYLRSHAARVVLVFGDAVCAECGSPKVLNTALLGATSAAGVLGVTMSELEASLRDLLPEKLVDMNVCALHAGARYVEGNA